MTQLTQPDQQPVSNEMVQPVTNDVTTTDTTSNTVTLDDRVSAIESFLSWAYNFTPPANSNSDTSNIDPNFTYQTTPVEPS